MGFGDSSAVQTKLNDFFVEWISSSDTEHEIEAIISDTAASTPTTSVAFSASSQPNDPTPPNELIRITPSFDNTLSDTLSDTISQDTRSITQSPSKKKLKVCDGTTNNIFSTSPPNSMRPSSSFASQTPTSPRASAEHDLQTLSRNQSLPISSSSPQVSESTEANGSKVKSTDSDRSIVSMDSFDVDIDTNTSDETILLSPDLVASSSTSSNDTKTAIVDASTLHSGNNSPVSPISPISPNTSVSNDSASTSSNSMPVNTSISSTSSPRKASPSITTPNISSLSSLSLDATAFSQGRIVGSGVTTQTGHRELGVMGIPRGEGVLTPVPAGSSSASGPVIHPSTKSVSLAQEYFEGLTDDTPVVSPSDSPDNSPKHAAHLASSSSADDSRSILLPSLSLKAASNTAHILAKDPSLLYLDENEEETETSSANEKAEVRTETDDDAHSEFFETARVESDPSTNLKDPISRALFRIQFPSERHCFYSDDYVRMRIAHCQHMALMLPTSMNERYDPLQLHEYYASLTNTIREKGPSCMDESMGLAREHFIPITDEIFVLSTYVSAMLFVKLLRYQLVWGTYPSSASLEEVNALVYPATIIRAYKMIFKYLDHDARLFFVLLPPTPPTKASLTPIPQWVLRRFFVSNKQHDNAMLRLVSEFNPTQVENLGNIDRMRGPFEVVQPGFDDRQRHESEYDPEEPLKYSRIPLRVSKNDAERETKEAKEAKDSETSQSHSSAKVVENNEESAVSTDGNEEFDEESGYFPSKYLTRTFLRRENFLLLMHDILNSHPGLEFLSQSPDFQDRYAQTVIARIFYSLNTRGDEMLTLRELRKSNLTAKLSQLYHCEDINLVHAYFSYEHFYVIYCKFWELDIDHDMFISQQDLARYEDNSLTHAILNSIFSQVPRKFLSGMRDRMGYEDFLVFIISEVEKSSPTALSYWFRALDLDADGVLTTYEISHFYDEQIARIRQFYNTEPMALPDAICQITDMINPKSLTPVFTKRDVERGGLFPTVCDMIFNLTRFLVTESRDVQRIRTQQTNPHQTEWDRWAAQAYHSLAGSDVEEESVDMGNMGMDMGMGMDMNGDSHDHVDMNNSMGMELDMGMDNMGMNLDINGMHMQMHNTDDADARGHSARKRNDGMNDLHNMDESGNMNNMLELSDLSLGLGSGMDGMESFDFGDHNSMGFDHDGDSSMDDSMHH